ncbi:ATP-grasp domain-containing protein [Sediminibacillus albus]|uniref:Gamma-F420-2:alpha-L-glutamate ligase n=1 Tax=Sediminibacillus albus TaxID=407036 RepID=A0A1G9BPJ3_9BACI|nr:ATP-grasp domain-containing protein [Sediminibacillus albus]SDK41180.1 gamma-F420-2:alpha-L-glutamate ligase [Sediminibacillus albus]
MRRTGWIIYEKEDAAANSSYIDWFIDECSKQGISLMLILRHQLTIGIFSQRTEIKLHNQIASQPDFCVVRTVEPLLTRQLELLGIPVFNPFDVSFSCNNKAITHQRVAQLEIPMVDTSFWHYHQLGEQLPIAPPFVIKEADGRGGKQVYLVESLREWQQTLPRLSAKDLLIQACNVQRGKDLRIFVVGKEIVGAVLRENAEDFRANFKLGGSASYYPISAQEKELVQKIINDFSFGMVGIDFLFDTAGGLLFNEIEDVVGSRTLSKVSSVNLLEKYVSFINEQIGG